MTLSRPIVEHHPDLLQCHAGTLAALDDSDSDDLVLVVLPPTAGVTAGRQQANGLPVTEDIGRQGHLPRDVTDAQKFHHKPPRSAYTGQSATPNASSNRAIVRTSDQRAPDRRLRIVPSSRPASSATDRTLAMPIDRRRLTARRRAVSPAGSNEGVFGQESVRSAGDGRGGLGTRLSLGNHRNRGIPRVN